MWYVILLSYVQFLGTQSQENGILYPRASETREVVSLDGLWNFRLEHPKTHPNTTLYLMPVPSSYNDITVLDSLRDHVGKVWYERTFFVPKSWLSNTRVWLRFGSVHYKAEVWINGKNVMKHEIGHLPFQADVSQVVKYGKSNNLTVSVDNTLTNTTVPQGTTKKTSQSYEFDFFNYAGIHRLVHLHTTPVNYIDDIKIQTDLKGTTGSIKYKLSIVKNAMDMKILVELLDAEDVNVGQVEDKEEATIEVKQAKFWWPYLMNDNPGYLYQLIVTLRAKNGDLLDVYRQSLGIRKISWTNSSLMINNRPIYFHGFGRHEDADIRGKGLDFPTIIRDHNLLRWIGANAYRTSHYPYAEETMDLADKLGIMIIDECSSVKVTHFSDQLMENHKRALTELVRRDRNRPSVVMWSIANEPLSENDKASLYFKAIAEHARSLDDSRPITLSTKFWPSTDRSMQYVDVVSFNRYNAWYQNTGQLTHIVSSVVRDATSWHEKFKKPVLMSEYGADTYPGLHGLPEFAWSEEFQVSMMSKHFEAFDKLRKNGWFVGEFVWNFADFQTSQEIRRVGGNRKGVFTRNRQPKASAHHLRKRNFLLAYEIYNITLPKDLFHYYISAQRSEL